MHSLPAESVVLLNTLEKLASDTNVLFCGWEVGGPGGNEANPLEPHMGAGPCAAGAEPCAPGAGPCGGAGAAGATSDPNALS